MRRKLLVSMTAIIMVAGLVCTSIPFASSLRLSAKARNDDIAIVETGVIQAGVLQKINVEGHQLFILRPDSAQWASIHQMDPFVWDKRMPAWSPDLNAFVFWGYGTRWGWELELKPAPASDLTHFYNDPNERSYFAKQPVWLGGYWNDRDEISYDLAGRTIKDYAHSFMGDTSELPNLTPARFNVISPGKLAVYRHIR